MTTTTAMTIEDLRNMVNGHDGEDRISTLPNELIHHIFSFLDVDVTVKTCVLSKRWVNLWTTLPFLNFRHNKSKGLLMSSQGFHDYNNNKDRWSKFDSQFLVKRNPNSDTSTVLIDYTVTELMARQIIEYASSHHVKHLCVNHFGYCYRNFSFPVLETLYINSIQPLNYWSMPSLTVLHCRGTIANNYCDRAFTFEGFHNLRELTLEGCRDFIHKDVFMIKFPNLVCLTISPGERYENHRCCEFVILAPKLSSFKCHGKFVPVMSTEGGFPCLKEVNFDLYDCQENIDKELMKKLNSLFSEFRGIELLTLSWGMIQVLREYSESWPSPFSNLKTLHVLDSNKNNSHVIKYFAHGCPDLKIVTHYLLNSSPGVKIFIEYGGQITNHNPEEDMLLNSFSYHVVKSKKPTTSSVQVDAAVLHRVTGVGPSQMVLREIFNHGSFSLWEGHHVCTEHLMLLRYIKEKQPQTFEHFVPHTGTVYNTVGLSTLCNSIKALSEVSSTLPASTITHFRALFTDLEKWGFNTTWLLNIVNNIDENSFTEVILINDNDLGKRITSADYRVA